MRRIRSALIHLAHENESLRSMLLPLLKNAAKWKSMPKGWTEESRKEFWKSLTGDAEHKVKECMDNMKGKDIDDPGAFCAALADRVDPGWRSRERAASDEAELRSRLVRLANENPKVRPHILPLIKSAAVDTALDKVQLDYLGELKYAVQEFLKRIEKLEDENLSKSDKEVADLADKLRRALRPYSV